MTVMSETIEEKQQKESEVKELREKYEQEMKAMREEMQKDMKEQMFSIEPTRKNAETVRGITQISVQSYEYVIESNLIF